MKLFNSTFSGKTLFCASLLTVLFALTSFSSIAAEEAANYQSPFADYKSLADDSLADWKTLHAQPDGGEHAGHYMHGMDHGDMNAMDHSQMNHSQMKHSEVPPMPDNTKPVMQSNEASKGESHAH